MNNVAVWPRNNWLSQKYPNWRKFSSCANWQGSEMIITVMSLVDRDSLHLRPFGNEIENGVILSVQYKCIKL